MKNILSMPINEKKSKKVIALILILCCLLPVVLNITCLSPLIFDLENNTLYKGTAISLTVKYISDLLTVLSFVSVYSIIIFSKVFLKKTITVIVCIVYFILLILKIPASLLMVIPIYGEIILADVLMLCFYFLLDSLQFALILIFVSVTIKHYLRSIDVTSKSSKTSYRTTDILPVSRYFDWCNPLLRASFYASITVAGFRIFSRLISSIGMTPPSSFNEVMIIIVDYLSDIVYGVAAYIIAIFIFNLLYDAIKKANIKELNNKDNQNLSKKENKADEKKSSALFED